MHPPPLFSVLPDLPLFYNWRVHLKSRVGLMTVIVSHSGNVDHAPNKEQQGLPDTGLVHQWASCRNCRRFFGCRLHSEWLIGVVSCNGPAELTSCSWWWHIQQAQALVDPGGVCGVCPEGEGVFYTRNGLFTPRLAAMEHPRCICCFGRCALQGNKRSHQPKAHSGGNTQI